MAGMPKYFRTNGYRCPTDPLDGPFQYAFQTKREAFNYWHQFPSILENFNTFMEGVRGSRHHWIEWFPVQERILTGFEGHQDDVLLIDIAGGRGHDIEAFRHKFSEVKGKLILQDLPAVISDIKMLDENIQRQEYDFFTPQTVQGICAFPITWSVRSYCSVGSKALTFSFKALESTSSISFFTIGPTQLASRFSLILFRP
ncbi:MAG: hypothetical protein Q9165_000962 [Trypethelium subeluteriae]